MIHGLRVACFVPSEVLLRLLLPFFPFPRWLRLIRDACTLLLLLLGGVLFDCDFSTALGFCLPSTLVLQKRLDHPRLLLLLAVREYTGDTTPPYTSLPPTASTGGQEIRTWVQFHIVRLVLTPLWPSRLGLL